MSLITFNGVDYGVGGPLLLERVDLAIEPGERIALIGRNGAGKSTLLRLLAGELIPDDGEIRREGGRRVARLEQEVPLDTVGSVFDVVAAGLGDLGKLLADYHHLIHAEHIDTDELARVQGRIEAVHGWSLDSKVEETLARLGLDGDASFAALSGGMKRRVLLARALVSAPDLLLLDEPTNHLDIEAIDWLEGFLKAWPGALVFVTHDRRFLRALATRIVEIDRGRVTSWPGDWANYERRREAPERRGAGERALRQDAGAGRDLDPAGHQGPPHPRRGPRAASAGDAQRTRRAARGQRQRAAADRAGRRVRAQGDRGARGVVRFRRSADRPRFLDHRAARRSHRLDRPQRQRQDHAAETAAGPAETRCRRGEDRHPASGRLFRPVPGRVARGLECAGQRRRRPSSSISAAAASTCSATCRISCSRPNARAPITRLSGGERNRLLLAKLFAQPSNLLVMDEPTNDLDVETLELLEELLADYPGTLLLVSHDRDFLDNVVTSTIVMEGDGRVGEYIGGYTDWVRQRSTPAPVGLARPAAAVAAPLVTAAPPKRKLSYKDARELELLPARIETLEARMAELAAQMNDPGFYQRDGAAIVAHGETLAATQAELDAAYLRWSELE